MAKYREILSLVRSVVFRMRENSLGINILFYFVLFHQVNNWLQWLETADEEEEDEDNENENEEDDD